MERTICKYLLLIALVILAIGIIAYLGLCLGLAPFLKSAGLIKELPQACWLYPSG